ncbi:transcription initiation factor TFIID subunit 8 [Abrus precatorius]|uniref:Transcription initiation factor TFIID subunit 8 n=1 Tax=Abrus precatorius TaxID=3816 RepID=A0A8B8KPK1_ABRPR|nr:transcription initiation factor TFIID subunit 8 [Abrus precatorius]XP_027345774.1 transcription initiation factor TFIID subunit 8 [Abrus precatorius]XP_027345782.1 transcription initiation factor TFIID subunit 8 [Abrus precatorius]
MNPMQNSISIKTTSKLPQRAKRKKKRDVVVNNLHVAETASEFSFAVAKTAVAQICQSVGFKTSKYNALETLTNVSTRYLEAIVRSAASFANASNRTDSNLFDLINGIHDLCSVQGFPGGSMMYKSNLLRSAALEEIMNFVNLSKDVPFAKQIPFRNVFGSQNPKAAVNEAKTQVLHVPRWLPDFPEENLYKNCQQVLAKERKCGEKLWEHSLATEDYSDVLQSNGINGKEKKDARMDFARKRERVKFKIGGEEEKQIGFGVNMMNGVCKGRKRVSWSHDKINDCLVEENEDVKR